MGALLTAWQLRIPQQKRVELTNMDNAPAQTENVAVSGAAETDTINTFLHMTGVAFDATNAEHIAIGVDGVTFFLYKYRGLPLNKAGQAAFDSWRAACDAFAHTRGSLAWQSPLTDSNLTPSVEPAGSRPYFDRENLTSTIPNPPSGGDPWGPYFPYNQ